MSSERLDLDPLKQFVRRVPSNGKVLDAGTGRDLRFFREIGLSAEGLPLGQDLRLLSVPKGTYDGIWAHSCLDGLPLEGIQRVMGIFFAALKPAGALFVSIEVGERYSSDDFASLLRQSGFTLQMTGTDPSRPTRIGFLAKRI